MKAVVIAPIATAVLLLAGCGSDEPKDKVVGTCGTDSNVTIEDCHRPDFGSCGNACCKVTTVIDLSAEDVASALNKSLSNGGADGYYTLQPLYEGVLGFTQLGNYSMYLGQAHHMTSGPAHFNDTVNILIEGTDDGKSTVTAFSTSLIAGALGDAGQGYKNIAMAMKAADFGDNKWDGSLKSQGGSCAAPSRQQEIAKDVQTAVSTRRLSSAVEGTCGLGNSTVEDCQNVDFGSCGNACCSLKITVPQSVEKTVSLLNASFDNGGADGQYTKAMTYEGTLGFADLTGLAPASFGTIFIGQVNHMTSGPLHFIDTVNFNLVEGSTSNETTITAFSLSLMGGSYGDAGQGYKNIKMAMDNAFGGAAKIAPGNFAQSCPSPAALV
jgi:hypothetical protein